MLLEALSKKLYALFQIGRTVYLKEGIFYLIGNYNEFPVKQFISDESYLQK